MYLKGIQRQCYVAASKDGLENILEVLSLKILKGHFVMAGIFGNGRKVKNLSFRMGRQVYNF